MKAEQLKTLIEDLGGKPASISSGSLMCCCPLHHESNPSFGISIDKPEHPWNCFVCGGSSSVVNLVKNKYGVDWREASRICSEYGSFSVPDLDFSRTSKEEFSYIGRDSLNELIKIYKTTKQSLSYHGLKKSTTLSAGIREDVFKNRIIIPWRDPQNYPRIMGMTSHSWGKSRRQAKQLPVLGFDFKQNIYVPPSFSLNRSDRKVIVCEGIADCLKIEEALSAFGIEDDYFSIALSSASITSNQVKSIRMLSPRAILVMLDNDEAGKTASVKLRQRIPDIPMSMTIPLSAKDAGDPSVSYEEIANSVINAKLYCFS